MLRLPPELRSVGLSRAKLTELARAWQTPAEVLDDARVVLSELMSNGVLHARTELEVVLSQRGQGLRVEVHDASSVPLLPPYQLPSISGSLLDSPEMYDDAEGLSVPAATGRGLSMVAALVTTWGWFPDAAGGKVVWAEVGTPGPGEMLEAERPGPRSGFGVRPVRLIAVPLRLLKASEDHFDDLFRELQMANLALPRTPSPSPPPSAGPGVAALAPQAEQVRARLARMREPVRRAIWEAARRGDRLVDLNLLADAGMPGVFEAVQRLLSRAAVAARRGLLLTEAPAREVGEWRRWLRTELEQQISGKPPRACPFPVAAVVGKTVGPAWEAQDSARRQALAALRALLEDETAVPGPAAVPPGFSEDELMVRGLSRAMAFVGARRSSLLLLAEDNETVRFGASVGFSADVADYWQAMSLSGDLPACEAIRTSRPLLFRTYAEFDARYPVFLSTPSESDPALACVPLKSGPDRSFGCVVFGFGQARDFSPRDVAFLDDLAGAIGASIMARRLRAEARAAAQRSAEIQAAALSMLAATSREDVLRELAEVVVAQLCEAASVHIVEAGNAVRYLITRHRDPERLAAAVSILQKRQHQEFASDSDDMFYECLRTGQTVVVQLLSDEAIAARALDEEDLALMRRLAMGAVGVTPVRTPKAMAALLSFGNSTGRFIADADLAALEQLAAAAGTALAQLGY